MSKTFVLGFCVVCSRPAGRFRPCRPRRLNCRRSRPRARPTSPRSRSAVWPRRIRANPATRSTPPRTCSCPTRCTRRSTAATTGTPRCTGIGCSRDSCVVPVDPRGAGDHRRARPQSHRREPRGRGRVLHAAGHGGIRAGSTGGPGRSSSPRSCTAGRLRRRNAGSSTWAAHHGARQALPRLPAEADVSDSHGGASEHAFGLAFALDYAVALGDAPLKDLVVARSRDYFLGDADYPAKLEPSGSDFLSPALVEADLMRRVLSPRSSPGGSRRTCRRWATASPGTC